MTGLLRAECIVCIDDDGLWTDTKPASIAGFSALNKLALEDILAYAAHLFTQQPGEHHVTIEIKW